MNLTSAVFGPDKMFAHLDRLAAWQKGELPPPVTVELDLTNLCNHACPDCTFSYLVNVDRSSIPADLAADLVDQLAALGVRGLTFSGGGEPLVWGAPRLLSLMSLARQQGLEVALITNGSLLRDERFLEMCSWIRVSLDAYDALTFERFHGRGKKEFTKVTENVARLAGASRLRRAAGLCCATLGVGFLTDRDSLLRGDLEHMAAFCAQIEGLDYLQFRPLVENMVVNPTLTGGYSGTGAAELEALADAYRQARQRHERPDFAVLWSADKYVALAQEDFGRTYDQCHAHFLQATISADAKVYICCHGQGQERFCLGDLHQNTFAEIWHSEQARLVRTSINPQAGCPPACRLHGQNVILQSLSVRPDHFSFI